MVAIYYAVKGSKLWRMQGALTARGPAGPADHQAASLDTHIATEWVNGRVRLDGLLALIHALGRSLEQEIAKLNRLKPSDPLRAREAHGMVGPALRRFTFDEHLRNECRVLVPLLEFCGKDLAESQGLDTADQLAALAEIGAAVQTVDRS